MLRRLLTFWLAISILGYGLALSADVHGVPHADSAQTPSGQSPIPDQGDGDPCGHCCHGLMHLLGLAVFFPALPAHVASRPTTRYSESRDSFLAPLPERPPTA